MAIRTIKLYEELNKSEDYQERLNYINEVIAYLKDICIPLYDNGIKIDISDSQQATAIIANIMYSDKYIDSYAEFYKNIMNKELKDLSDIFYIFIKLPFVPGYIRTQHIRFHNLHYTLPDWILDVIHHIESYMISEGFKIKITLYNPFGSSWIANSTNDIKSDSSEPSLIIRDVRVGFYI